jgi:hypothetical protein
LLPLCEQCKQRLFLFSINIIIIIIIIINTTAVVAYPSGRLLNTFECDIFDLYYLNPTAKCYKNIPVRYKIHQEEHQGFLLPISQDIIPADIDLPCTAPVHAFLLGQGDNATNKRQFYQWNGSAISTSEANFTSVAFIEHAPNLTYLHLISSRVVDTNADNTDVLTDLSSTKDMMLAYAHMAGIDMTILDTEQLTLAASSTLDMVHKTVYS